MDLQGAGCAAGCMLIGSPQSLPWKEGVRMDEALDGKVEIRSGWFLYTQRSLPFCLVMLTSVAVHASCTPPGDWQFIRACIFFLYDSQVTASKGQPGSSHCPHSMKSCTPFPAFISLLPFSRPPCPSRLPVICISYGNCTPDWFFLPLLSSRVNFNDFSIKIFICFFESQAIFMNAQ